jgi:hypothetical protein
MQGHVEVNGRTIPLQAVVSGSYLQGRIERPAFPARMTAKLRLKDGGPEYRFDFTFTGVTRDPNVVPERATPAPVRAASVQPQRPPANQSSSIDPALIQVPIPATVPGILVQLRTRDGQVRELIDKGNLAAVFVPAFQARDLAIALEGQLERVAAARRDGAGAAIDGLVRAAWLLDAFGDVGNREQALAAYALFHQASTDIAAAFAGIR